jgi:hypothetical protein
MKNTLAVFALFALTSAACDRTPLRTVVSDGASETAVDTSSATATKTDTVSATQTATVQTTAIQTVSDTVTSIDTATSIVTTTPTATVTATATETQPDTVPVTVSQTATDTSTSTITATFTIAVTVDKVDAYGHPAEDYRSFGIQFSGPAVDLHISIIETVSGVVFEDSPIMTDGSENIPVYVSPGNWTTDLKPNTSYTWTVRATANYPVVGPKTVSVTGEFTTFAFSPDNASCDQGICFEYAYGWGQTVAPGATGVQVLEFWLTAGPKDETINGSDFHFSAIGYDPSDQTPFSNSSGSFFKNIRVTQSSGNVVSGPIAATSPYTSNEQAHVSFLDQFTVNARTSVLLILTLDVSPDFVPPTNGISYSVMMNSVGTNDTLTVLYGAHFITDPWPTFTVK